METIWIIGVLIAVVVGAFLIQKLQGTVIQRFQSGIDPASQQRAFELSGYRHVGMEPAPLEQQAQRSLELMKNYGDYTIEMVRDVGTHRVLWEMRTRPYQSSDSQLPGRRPLRWKEAGGKTSRVPGAVTHVRGSKLSFGWRIPLSSPPTVLLHIADRALRDVGDDGSESPLNPEYPGAGAIGDRELDARFDLYAPDPAAARRRLSDAAVRTALLALTTVNVIVRSNEVLFDDPMQSNILAALGGMGEMIAMASDPGQIMARSLPVHDRIAALMVRLCD